MVHRLLHLHPEQSRLLRLGLQKDLKHQGRLQEPKLLQSFRLYSQINRIKYDNLCVLLLVPSRKNDKWRERYCLLLLH